MIENGILDQIKKMRALFMAVVIIAVGLTCAFSTEAFASVKGTSLSSVTGSTHSVKVVWKKCSAKVTGYQVEYKLAGTSSWAKKTITGLSKTSTTIKKLKSGKRYYVKVRTFKTVSGKKNYSKWSSSKSAKTKVATSSSSSGGGEVYRTATGSKYHLGWCPTLKIKIATTRSEAKSMGLGPCKVCNP